MSLWPGNCFFLLPLMAQSFQTQQRNPILGFRQLPLVPNPSLPKSHPHPPDKTMGDDQSQGMTQRGLRTRSPEAEGEAAAESPSVPAKPRTSYDPPHPSWSGGLWAWGRSPGAPSPTCWHQYSLLPRQCQFLNARTEKFQKLHKIELIFHFFTQIPKRDSRGQKLLQCIGAQIVHYGRKGRIFFINKW